MELDHVFIGCTAGGPEGDALLNAGFVEGSPNRHSGQGTSNRRFFFRNAYLELLWVHDAAEAQSERTRPARLWERCAMRATGVSPFGLVFRPRHHGNRPPFATWSYRPQYLPSGTIELAQGTSLAEPELIFLPFARTHGMVDQPMEHRNGIETITGPRVGVPALDALTSASRAAEHLGMVRFFASAEHVLELASPELGSRAVDLTPMLPLRFVGVNN